MGATAALGIMAGIQAYGSYSEAEGTKAQGKFQQSIHDYNARVSELQATDAVDRGEEMATEIGIRRDANLSSLRKGTGNLKSTQKVSLAAQGIETETGSAAQILSDTEYLSSLDELELKKNAAMDIITTKNNAFRKAMGFKIEAEQYGMKGRMTADATDNAVSSTLMTGGLQTANLALRSYGSYSEKHPPRKR